MIDFSEEYKKIPDTPRSLAKIYGPNWKSRPDAKELQKQFNKVVSARSKALKEYKKLVKQSNKEIKGNPAIKKWMKCKAIRIVGNKLEVRK